MASETKQVLILCKTYPSPSAKYAETSCIAGMEESGKLIRLYPVPFRLIRDEQQFKKWQIIEARVEKAKYDRRPESYKIFIDTIRCCDEPLSTHNNWESRRAWLSKLPVFSDFKAMEEARQQRGDTLALLRPSKILKLEIEATANPEWTDEEKRKLLQLQHQGNLFDADDAQDVALLRKLPHDFYYRYECESEGNTISYRHKIVDWEAGALYWNVRARSGAKWQEPFRQKLERDLPAKDLIFLMGTVHRFPDQWLLVSLIYPPKCPSGDFTSRTNRLAAAAA